ncbi:MAG: hypothetical protein K6U03_04490, partial [Firmicutes bacterium]|nr:hypothetical protein [Bacillota bacterium]
MKKESIIELSIILIIIQCIHLIILTVERIVHNPIILGPIPVGFHTAVVLLAAFAGIFLAFKTSRAERERIRLETTRRLRREDNESMNEALRLIWSDFHAHLRL